MPSQMIFYAHLSDMKAMPTYERDKRASRSDARGQHVAEVGAWLDILVVPEDLL